MLIAHLLYKSSTALYAFKIIMKKLDAPFRFLGFI